MNKALNAQSQRPLILVVDDDEAIRLLFEEELHSEGYEVLSASNGKEALDLVERYSPDLVTLDIKMPEMDGFRVLRELKAARPHLPIVMVTAFSSFRHDHDTELADAYEVKSSDLTNLKATIRRLLAASGPH